MIHTVERTESKSVSTYPSAERLVEEYEHREVAAHPLFVWMQNNPVNLEAIWILVANLRAGISSDFVRWLATAIERTDNRPIASILAKQLNDELGNGEIDQIHSLLLDSFMAGLDSWKPKKMHPGMLEPGRRLAERATKIFHAVDPYDGIGALMVGEIFAKKMDHCLGEQIRRQNLVDVQSLRWLIIHEALEVDHAEDSLELARLVPKRDAVLSAVWRGARAQWEILWEYLDGVHAMATGQNQSS